jgi:glyoxylase-like metal-dependent hydrolase (beta-lactamase superfamily II)
LYCAEGKFVLCGDSLFFHSIGRTDLPGGNHAQLVEAVNSKLMTLPTDTTVLPGHGPYTTIAEERMGNPFI